MVEGETMMKAMESNTMKRGQGCGRKGCEHEETAVKRGTKAKATAVTARE
jgi:hypothetical protein